MSLLCGWCGLWIRKESPVGLASHGCCRACADKILKTMREDENLQGDKPCKTH